MKNNVLFRLRLHQVQGTRRGSQVHREDPRHQDHAGESFVLSLTFTFLVEASRHVYFPRKEILSKLVYREKCCFSTFCCPFFSDFFLNFSDSYYFLTKSLWLEHSMQLAHQQAILVTNLLLVYIFFRFAELELGLRL